MAKPTAHPERRHSPLTRRILAVNILAPALLLVGIFYLGEYRRTLIVTELSALRSNAEIFGVALGEIAVSSAGEELLPGLGTQIVRRLALTAETRARLFSNNGELVADSRNLLQPGGAVIETDDLAPLLPMDQRDGFLTWAFSKLDIIYQWLPGIKDYPPYTENVIQHADDYQEVTGAMQGVVWMGRRSMPDGTLILSVAVPVTRYKHIMGVLMLSKSSDDIDKAMYEVRKDTLQVFAAILIFTVLVSMYLGGTIARPIRQLSRAADLVRGGGARQHAMPDLGLRNDEIGDLSAALTDMTDALWTRMEAIEAFAADVSHEIKNPLTSLKSAVETFKRIQDPTQQQKLLDIIVDDVERLDRLITDISDASRIDAELSRASTEDIDMDKLLSTLADLHGSTSPHLNVTSEPNLIVNGMTDRLVQVLRNLISNAVSFSPKDGTITLDAIHEGPWAIITVKDQGIGIPPGKEQDIFSRFYTERPDTEEFGRHSGLGLSISQQIVQAHGGSITVHNLESGGACFTLRLPLAT